MSDKHLKNIKIDNLEQIIEGFKKLFQCEAQFQFDLAWKLKEMFDCEVKLEELSAIVTSNKDSKRKLYTDIILTDADGSTFIAIELKYKTASLEEENIKNHGAVDEGCYDFITDISRVEMLVKGSMLGKEEIDIKRPCDKGFCIFLTNEKGYWKPKKSGTPPNYDNFRFTQKSKEDRSGKISVKNGELDWREYSKSVKGTLRGHPIKLMEKEYSYEWKDYQTFGYDNNSEFRYIIIEVTK